MVKVKPTNTQNKITVKTNVETNTYSIKDNMSEYYAKQAENWAHSEYIVDGVDYSAKYYANKAKESVDNLGTYKEDVEEIVNSFEADVQTAKTDIENARVLSIQDVSNTCASFSATLDDVIAEKTQDLDVIFDSKKEELETLNDEIIDNCKDIIGRVGFNMFDTVIKDRVLTYEESKGLALQGTWVYKTAIAGERYGYPDFYNTCVKEFKESTTATENNVTVKGTITNNNGVLSGFSDTNYPLLPAMFNPTDNSWEIVLSFTRTGENTTWESLLGAGVSDWTYGIHIYNRDSKICMQASSNGTSWDVFSKTGTTTLKTNTKYWVKLVYNKSSYTMWLSTTGKFNGEETLEAQVASSTDILVTTTQSLGSSKVATGHQFLGSIDLNECYIDINGARWWDGVRLRRHSNGHYYYPISAKATIDSRFNSSGVAWYYGIDEANERVFLPRDNFFAINGVAPVVGNGKTLGLIARKENLSGGVDSFGLEITKSFTLEARGASYGDDVQSSISSSASTVPTTTRKVGVTTDATNSGVEAHLKTNEDKCLYICVGNTVSDTSWIDAVTQVQNGVRDLEQTTQECIEEVELRGAELRSKMGLSMFDTIIKDHLLTYLESKGLALQGTYVYKNAIAGSRYGYPDFYNKVVEEYNEARALGAQKFTQDGQAISMYIHPNGHMYYRYKSNTKENVDNWYNTFGTAWFYGVDEENERIFLPRDKYFSIQGKVAVAGNGRTFGITDGVNTGGMLGRYGNLYGAFDKRIYDLELPATGYSSGISLFTNGDAIGITTDATKSGIEGKLQANKEKYLYICVGNTESVSSVTDVVEVTTTENDTVPLFTGQYFDFTPNNLSWLKAGQQANNAGIYATCYNELVNVLNGETKYGDLKVVDTDDMIVGVDYSEYWKVNQVEMTFTTPSKISYLPINADTAPVVGNGTALGVTDGTTLAGLQCGGGQAYNLQPKDWAYGADTGYNKGASTGANLANYVAIGVTTDATKSGLIADLAGAKSQTSQLYFKVANAVQNLELLDVGKVMEQAVLKSQLVDAQVVVETYINGTSWYRVWSDGWCEQGGESPATKGLFEPVFLKQFRDTNYNFIHTQGGIDTNEDASADIVRYDLKSTVSIPVYKYSAVISAWRAGGYIA